MTKVIARVTLVCVVFLGTWILIQSRSVGRPSLRGVADSRATETKGLAEIEIGEQLCPPIGEHWPQNSSMGTLVIVSDPSCAYCDSERPLHDQLYASAVTRGLAAVYVPGKASNQSERANELLKMHRNVWWTSAGAIGVIRLPTLILVDPLGKVTAKWVGAIPSARRGDILVALIAGESFPNYGRVPRDEFIKSLEKNPDMQILALRDPEKVPALTGARYIPFDELSVRGAYELKRDKPLYVDCQGTDKFTCQRALMQLGQMDFPRVVGVGLMTTNRTCAVKR